MNSRKGKTMAIAKWLVDGERKGGRGSTENF